jgi:RNA polymerase sigma-70 factor, ECF subfamily
VPWWLCGEKAFLFSSCKSRRKTLGGAHLTNNVQDNSPPGNADAMVASCRRGDSAAQRALYDTFHRRVYRLAVRFAGQKEAADLTQEIFLRVFAGLDGFRGNACFATWLYRVALNACLGHRRAVRPAPGTLTIDPVSREVDPGQRLEESDALEHALQQVDPSLRAVFLLRHVEALDYKQISEVLGIPVSTAATRLARARTELQRLLQNVAMRSST